MDSEDILTGQNQPLCSPQFSARLFSLLQKRELNAVHLQTADVTPARQQELRAALQTLQEKLLELQQEAMSQQICTLSDFQVIQQKLLPEVQASIANFVVPTQPLSAPFSLISFASTLQPVPLLAFQSQPSSTLSTTTPANLKEGRSIMVNTVRV